MSGETIRALVVEDDPAWQELLAEILSDDGFQVDIAGDLDNAVLEMRAAPHRLAVVDLSLGGTDHRNQDGLGALTALRRHDPNCVPLLLTGFATVELAVRVMREYGALTCLRKESFRRPDFRMWVDRALAVAPGTAELSAGDPIAAAGGSGFLGSPIEARITVDAPRSEALIVEDDAGWRSLLTELLAEAGFGVTACSSYVEALGLLKRSRFALAVVDLSLASSLAPHPNRDGYRLLASSQLAGIPTIVVSGFAEPAVIERAYEDYGIAACMEKQAFDRQIFLRAVQEAERAKTLDPDLAKLTAREREVLELLARGLTNKEIAGAIGVSPNTVKRHLKSIYTKLEVHTRAAASAKAVAAGLLTG